jgi:hypothetical protein
MHTRAVINLHFGGARQISIPGLQAKVAAALRHLGKDKESLEILLRDPLVMDNGSIKSNLDISDITGHLPHFISFGEAKDLQGQDGILFADSSRSFSRMSDEEITKLAEQWMSGLEGAWYDYLDSNPGAEPDWMDNGDLESDIRLKTGYNGELSLWMIQEYIENHTPLFTDYVGDEWANMLVASPKFFNKWANRVLGNSGDD